MPKKSLENWLQEIESFHSSEIDLGLERISKVAERLDCLDFACPVISIAGTNGKGSCVELLKQLAIHSRKRVGVYTSPHLFSFNERIVINDEPVCDQQLIEAFEAVNSSRLACSPIVSLSFFEFTTLAALWIFKRQGLDLLVLEVGLGGRLDAVNIVDADIAVITSIGIDHEAWLGHDRESIAQEKAGIARQGKPMVVGEQDVPVRLGSTLDKIGAKPLYLNQDYLFQVQNKQVLVAIQSQSADSLNSTATVSSEITLSMENATLAPVNVATALQAFACLQWPFDAALAQQAINSARLPGRFQVFQYHDNWVIADLTHNPAGATFFSRQLDDFIQTHKPAKISALCGVMKDKDFPGMVRALSSQVDTWMLSDLPVPRAATAQELKAVLASEGIESVSCFASINQALAEYFCSPQEQVLLIVFGSFVSVAPAIEYMSKLASSVE